MPHKPVYYGEYFQLEKIIDAQKPESFAECKESAHDEMLFIIIHQSYEVWFKQILFEVESVINIMNKPQVNDNSPEMQTVVHRLQRVITILRILVQQIDIIETMMPMDFLDFRDMLRPASGFQSWQFKILEAKLGLKFAERHGQEYYTSQLQEKERALIKAVEDGSSVLQMINQWLDRMPFAEDAQYWGEEDFWKTYENIYSSSLAEAEKNNLESFRKLFLHDDPHRALSSKASRNALFIMMYRGYPLSLIHI